jgi:hypothetical protein
MKSCEFAVRHGLSPVESGTYIGGYRQLSVHRVGFYPIHLDKPAVPDKLDRVATVNPIKFWAGHPPAPDVENFLRTYGSGCATRAWSRGQIFCDSIVPI